MFHKPALLIKDPELMTQIMTKDFKQFNNRAMSSDTHDALGYNNLLLAKYPLWKFLRSKLSTFFTPLRMKLYFHLMEDVSTQLNEYLRKEITSDEMEIDIFKLSNSFAVNISARIFFGVDTNGFENFNDEVQQIVESISHVSLSRFISAFIIFVLPQYAKLFNVTLFGAKANKLYREFISKVMKMRQDEKRNDLIDMLNRLKREDQLPDDVLIAQSAILFAAGFETASNSITVALFELSKQPKLQEKLRDEIRSALHANGNIISHEVLLKLPFLDQIVKEALRMYAPLAFNDRICTNPEGYSLEPYSDFKIPCGMAVYFPLMAIGRDEKYFKDSLKFNPERFSPDNPNFTTFEGFPFGNGPKKCIGERLAQVEIKKILFEIFKNYRLEPTSTTPIEFKPDLKALSLRSAAPIKLNFIKSPILDI
jgi:cytochrome P450 family 6